MTVFGERVERQVALSHDDHEVVGVGDCVKRPGSLGHVWERDASRPCHYCGLPGRDFLGHAGEDRMLLFDSLRLPVSSHGKAAKST